MRPKMARSVTGGDPGTGRSQIQWDASNARIRFDGLAGYVRLGPSVFHIIPKFMDQSDWAIRWSRIASRGGARGSVVVLPGSLAAAWVSRELVDPVARYFAESLTAALDAYPLLLRERFRGRLPYVRGRILVEKELSRHWDQSSMITCTASRLTSDNRVVRLLRETCEQLLRQTRERTTRRRLQSCLNRLPIVRTRSLPRDLGSLQLPAGMDSYRAPVEMSVSFWKSRRVTVAREHGTGRSASVLAVMHMCFERLVAAAFRSAAAQQSMASHSQRPFLLATRPGDGLGYGSRSAVPDDVVTAGIGGAPRTVADAKYKGIGRWVRAESDARRANIPRDDFNQVIAACVAAEVTSALLVYPRVEDLDPRIAGFESWIVESPVLQSELRIGVVRLDMRSLSEANWFESLTLQLGSALEQVALEN